MLFPLLRLASILPQNFPPLTIDQGYRRSHASRLRGHRARGSHARASRSRRSNHLASSKAQRFMPTLSSFLETDDGLKLDKSPSDELVPLTSPIRPFGRRMSPCPSSINSASVHRHTIASVSSDGMFGALFAQGTVVAIIR